MAASSQKMSTPGTPAPQKAPRKPRTPAAEMTEKQKREAFASQATRALRTLERTAKIIEKSVNRGWASENQLAVLQKGVGTLTDRVLRASRGESTPGGFSVPSE